MTTAATSPVVTPDVELRLASELDAVLNAGDAPSGLYGAAPVDFAAILARAKALFPVVAADYDAVKGLLPSKYTDALDNTATAVKATIAAAVAIQAAFAK